MTARRQGKEYWQGMAIRTALQSGKRIFVASSICPYAAQAGGHGVTIELEPGYTWEDFVDTYELLTLDNALDSSPVDSSSDAIPLDYSARKNETAHSAIDSDAQRINSEVKRHD